MPARRFFVEGVRHTGEVVEIEGGDAHKIAHVLRLNGGDRIEIVDSAGTIFTAVLAVEGARVRAELIEKTAIDDGADRDRLRVDVAQAVPKGQRMELVVEKVTELGAAAILPFYCERSVARDVGASKLERWRRITRTAAQQCGRLDIPEILAPMTFDALLSQFPRYDRVLFPWELAPREPLRETLPPRLSGAHSALVVVGPEGGFSHAEAEAAQRNGAALLWLGRRILRTETAAMALLAVIDALAS